MLQTSSMYEYSSNPAKPFGTEFPTEAQDCILGPSLHLRPLRKPDQRDGQLEELLRTFSFVVVVLYSNLIIELDYFTRRELIFASKQGCYVDGRSLRHFSGERYC